ncbi:hypothetical protein NLI96_g8798 [Meripilus lineatus]|uniref:Uncharacterized protein n=1 Tax=Meripilus lineatus TaxID=2056292 RepID=A0AAD5UWS6_9APHY|nr:hypothetical protein NLI96_g8798 [Physisporinus lineatus]
MSTENAPHAIKDMKLPIFGDRVPTPKLTPAPLPSTPPPNTTTIDTHFGARLPTPPPPPAVMPQLPRSDSLIFPGV